MKFVGIVEEETKENEIIGSGDNRDLENCEDVRKEEKVREYLRK